MVKTEQAQYPRKDLWIPGKGKDGGNGGKGGVPGHFLGRDVCPPLTSCSGFLLVVLDGHDEEHQQGDALNPCQEEEVVVQGAVVDVTCGEETWRWMLEETGEVKSKEQTMTHSQQNGSFITKYNTQLNYTCGARGVLLSFLWTSKEALLRYARQFSQVVKSNALDFITQTLKASHDLFLLTPWCSIKDVRKKAVRMKCNPKLTSQKTEPCRHLWNMTSYFPPPQINVFCIGVREGWEQGRKMERHQPIWALSALASFSRLREKLWTLLFSPRTIISTVKQQRPLNWHPSLSPFDQYSRCDCALEEPGR